MQRHNGLYDISPLLLYGNTFSATIQNLSFFSLHRILNFMLSMIFLD
eukprot:UN27785